MEFLSKITVTCFAASYAVVFALELSRVFFSGKRLSAGVRRYLKIGFAAAGLFAHSVYLVIHSGISLDLSGIWLGNWFAWCLTAAWLLVATYLWLMYRKHETAIGLVLLPLTLALIGTGLLFGGENQFSPTGARSVWNMVHGASLLLGTTVVVLGFIFGLVYLVQAYRLKHKKVASRAFRMPSLEWLQQSSERSLLISAVLLGIGLVSGIALNQVPGDGKISGKIAWSDPVIWTSGILFLWLAAAAMFNLLYRPARQGRKVAYLVVASFLFLMLELGIVWWVGHATSNSHDANRVSSSEVIAPSTGPVNDLKILNLKFEIEKLVTLQPSEARNTQQPKSGLKAEILKAKKSGRKYVCSQCFCLPYAQSDTFLLPLADMVEKKASIEIPRIVLDFSIYNLTFSIPPDFANHSSTIHRSRHSGVHCRRWNT